MTDTAEAGEPDTTATEAVETAQADKVEEVGQTKPSPEPAAKPASPRPPSVLEEASLAEAEREERAEARRWTVEAEAVLDEPERSETALSQEHAYDANRMQEELRSLEQYYVDNHDYPQAAECRERLRELRVGLGRAPCGAKRAVITYRRKLEMEEQEQTLRAECDQIMVGLHERFSGELAELRLNDEEEREALAVRHHATMEQLVAKLDSELDRLSGGASNDINKLKHKQAVAERRAARARAAAEAIVSNAEAEMEAANARLDAEAEAGEGSLEEKLAAGVRGAAPGQREGEEEARLVSESELALRRMLDEGVASIVGGKVSSQQALRELVVKARAGLETVLADDVRGEVDLERRRLRSKARVTGERRKEGFVRRLQLAQECESNRLIKAQFERLDRVQRRQGREKCGMQDDLHRRIASLRLRHKAEIAAAAPNPTSDVYEE
mmetsp:Transcript_30543/g.99261  ORF Transcript_30543/g.99261 Transcript_30543/m.99261 type:complete len:443 (-) Transcript_30543:58-1386(-)